MHFLQKFADELESGHLFELVWLPLQAMCSYARLLHHSRTAGGLELEGSGPFAYHVRQVASASHPNLLSLPTLFFKHHTNGFTSSSHFSTDWWLVRTS
jgi:hypothetical protein